MDSFTQDMLFHFYTFSPSSGGIYGFRKVQQEKFSDLPNESSADFIQLPAGLDANITTYGISYIIRDAFTNIPLP